MVHSSRVRQNAGKPSGRPQPAFWRMRLHRLRRSRVRRNAGKPSGRPQPAFWRMRLHRIGREGRRAGPRNHRLSSRRRWRSAFRATGDSIRRVAQVGQDGGGPGTGVSEDVLERPANLIGAPDSRATRAWIETTGLSSIAKRWWQDGQPWLGRSHSPSSMTRQLGHVTSSDSSSRSATN